MWKFFVPTLLLVIAVILILAAQRPDTFTLARSVKIHAPAEKIFPFINDFHEWPLWSPYDKVDPNMKKVYSGSGSGKGAIFEWEGNSQAGAGRCEILESTPYTSIKLSLKMFKPFNCHNTVEFTLNQEGAETTVTWSMSGPATYFGKLLGMLFSDRMVRNQFDQGLSQLKTISEK